jgi:hypothetical protein
LSTKPFLAAGVPVAKGPDVTTTSEALHEASIEASGIIPKHKEECHEEVLCGVRRTHRDQLDWRDGLKQFGGQ